MHDRIVPAQIIAGNGTNVLLDVSRGRLRAVVKQAVTVEAGVEPGDMMPTPCEHISEQYPDVAVSSSD